MTSRSAALERAAVHFERGSVVKQIARLVAVPTESQDPAAARHLHSYLTEHIRPALEKLGFVAEVLVNPGQGGPLLLAERIEDPDLPTVLLYGHGDVVRGQAESWSKGLSPWQLSERDGRLYGRGVADSKGQHALLIAALEVVLAERGKLGFNARFLIETAEEIGSPGLLQLCEAHRERLAADLLLASDGPRLQPDLPTIYLGARGAFDFDLRVDLRASPQHSGNWGGLLGNPAIVLAHAIAQIVDAKGRILIPELKPKAIPPNIKRLLARVDLEPGEGDPEIDPGWGEPDLCRAEQLFGWSSFDVLAWSAGNPEQPVNAIPPSASARCQIRYTVDADPARFLPAIAKRLADAGLQQVQLRAIESETFGATRTDPEHRWVRFASRSIERTTGKPPMLLPNTGGSLPNACFSEVLGLPTIWVPHSHRGCQQHAPDEHALPEILREGLLVMTGLFYDLGDPGAGP